MKRFIFTSMVIFLITIALAGMAGADIFNMWDNTAYTDVPIVSTNTVSATTVTATTGFTGTASEVKVGNIIDTSFGLKNSTAGNAQVNLTSSGGLKFGTGSGLGAIAVEPTDFIDTRYGLLDSSDDIRVNLSSGAGLKFGTGATLGAIAVEPTDFIATSYGLMDSSDDIRVNLTANKGLEFGTGVALGSLQIKLDGASLTTGSSGIKVNGTDTVEVGGVVASGTSYFNDTTVGSGDALTVTTADKLTVATVIVPVYETITFPITNQSVDEYVFVADDAWWLVKAEEIHSVAGTATSPNAANVTVRICDDNEAPGSGINSTTAVIPLNDAVNNINTASLNNSNCLIADGDMVALDYAGTMTSVRGSITLTLRRM